MRKNNTFEIWGYVLIAFSLILFVFGICFLKNNKLDFCLYSILASLFLMIMGCRTVEFGIENKKKN